MQKPENKISVYIPSFQKLLLLFVCALLLLTNLSLHAAPISRSITISGTAGTDATFKDWTTSNNNTGTTVQADWNTPTDVTNNSGQFSTDGIEEAICPTPITLAQDLDCGGGGGVGRDLKKFSFSYDINNLYMYVERFASATNVNDWWFYLDTDADGLMETGESVLRVKWSGSNGSTVRELWTYTAARGAAGDPLTCPATGPNSLADAWCPVVGEGDGYDMPGTVAASITSYPTIYGGAEGGSGLDASGGALDGVSMETFVSWSDMGKSGPGSVGFHISSSNGTNLPKNIIDNMSGVGTGGSSISFSELAITKTASIATIVGGNQFTYTLTVTNNGDSDTTNVEVTDIFPANVIYSSDDVTAPQTTNLTGSTLVWNIPTLASGASTSLIVTMDTAIVAVDSPVSNTAEITDQDNSEINNPDDNTDTADITLTPAPSLTLLKMVQTFSDPVNIVSNPKAIPDALLDYTIIVTNSGAGSVDTDSSIITDPIPTGTELFVGNISDGSDPATAGNGPVLFTDGAGAASSTLTYTFTALANLADDVHFSSTTAPADTNDPAWDYVPISTGGFDNNVKFIRITPKGSHAEDAGTSTTYRVKFRVKLQ